MNFLYSFKKVNAIKSLLILFILSVVSIEADAQRFSRFGRNVKRGAKTNIGLEASMGTRSFKMESDIAAIDGMAVPLEGLNFGGIVGNKFYRVKLKQGFFKSAPAVPEKFELSETKGILNLYLLQTLNKKPKYFEPYLITAIDRGLLKFYGGYVDISKKSSSGSGSGSSSGDGDDATTDPHTECGEGLGDPDEQITLPPTDPSAEDPDNAVADDPAALDPSRKDYLGKISTMRANVGLGLECHIPGKKNFVNLFAEIQYGIPFSTSTKDIPFNSTKATGMLAVNFGLSFGITR
jgi:hypothetical protein